MAPTDVYLQSLGKLMDVHPASMPTGWTQRVLHAPQSRARHRQDPANPVRQPGLALPVCPRTRRSP